MKQNMKELVHDLIVYAPTKEVLGWMTSYVKRLSFKDFISYSVSDAVYIKFLRGNTYIDTGSKTSPAVASVQDEAQKAFVISAVQLGVNALFGKPDIMSVLLSVGASSLINNVITDRFIGPRFEIIMEKLS
jgi:hypothetical protein